MFSVTFFRFSFTSSWKLLFWVVMAVGLLIGLGIWQLHRAAEKRTMLALNQLYLNSEPAIIPGESVQQYQRVQVKGVAQLPDVLLLDNQHHAHQFGYDVLTPLLLADGKIVLIDHGWIPGDPSRASLPDLTQIPDSLHYTGQVYYPAKHPFALGAALEIKIQHLAVIETLNMAMISQFLHKSLYPFIIRQSVEQETRFLRDWPIVASSPIRHIGYAAQWFFFALGVGVMYIVLHTKRRA